MKNKQEIDMCHGPLFLKTLRFALPLMLSGVIQLLFGAADLAVVGRFTGSRALASVGATGSVSNCLINICMGFSVSANVLVARYYGAKDPKNMAKAAGNAVLVGIVGGIILAFVGFFLSRPLLVLLKTPEDVLDGAVLYMRIYFCGMPVIAVYNFGSAVLRAVGDTVKPLLFLIIAGVLNVILNLVLVIVFHMGVAGVAIATVASQCVSTTLVVRVLRRPGDYALTRESMRPEKTMMLEIVRIGLPAGICSSLFSLSNSVIQSSVNFFGSDVVAGNSAASNIDGFACTMTDAVGNAALAFTSQNLGAGKYDRIRKIFVIDVILVSAVSLLGGLCMVIFGKPLLSIYTGSAAAIEAGYVHLLVMGVTYVSLGNMNMMVGMVRGLGYSMLPTVISLSCVCGLRLTWIYTYFASHKTMLVLYLCYPLSWIAATLLLMICFFVIMRRIRQGHLPHSVAGRHTGIHAAE